jgi:16S rRNA (guanine(966)-N(2))-methyltransferase RsmD
MSGLRVVAGKARGHKLRAVPGDTTRPITDRVKESLFNILGGDIQEASFLDLFAGTGSVGIEALSRGAAYARFLDINPNAIKTIRLNLQQTGLAGQAHVLRVDAFQYLQSQPDRRFDYVYIAPPQYKEMWLQAIKAVNERSDWLSDDAWVMVQIHPKEYKHVNCNQLQVFDQRKYGSTLLVFYQRK